MVSVSSADAGGAEDMPDTSPSLLNIGCGSRFHDAWTNLDVAPIDPSVLAHDVRSPLPFPDARFDFVYHSHVLEHLEPADAVAFLRECHRVTRPGGTLRVVVPDLQQIATLYLRALENASRGDADWAHHYDWMLLELLDQVARHRSGGRMVEWLRDPGLPNREFVLQRLGEEARAVMASAGAPVVTPGRRGARLRRAFGSVGRRLRNPREALARLLLGADFEALRIGRFRLSGEVHQWMYDEYSLARLLRQCSFESPRRLAATESSLPGWAEFRLDATRDGAAHKPDSLYMEAIRPADGWAAEEGEAVSRPGSPVASDEWREALEGDRRASDAPVRSPG
jgi:predicted SAM-dependent methyltransferase